MAEKKVIIFTCDRCGLDHNRLRGKNLPAGWENVKGNDLCPVCMKALSLFLAGEPLPSLQAQQGVVKQPLRRSSDEYEQAVVAEYPDGSPRLIMNTPLIPDGEGVKI